MQTDKELKTRLAEIKEQRIGGSIDANEAKLMREDAFLERKAGREGQEWQNHKKSTLPTQPIWKGEVLGSVNPKEKLFFDCLKLLNLLLKSGVRDSVSGSPRIKHIPATSKKQAGKKVSIKRIKKVNYDVRIPDGHHILFALMPKKDGTGIHSEKHEVFNPNNSSDPLFAAYRRANLLESSGWMCAILRTPINGEAPKAGWGPKDQSLVKPGGMICRPKEQALFGLHNKLAGHKAKGSLIKDSESMRDLMIECRRLLVDDRYIGDVDLPLPEIDGLIVYNVVLVGPIVTGQNEFEDDVCMNTFTRKARPATNVINKDGATILGSGPRIRAEQIALDIGLGRNGTVTAHSVSYDCPELGEVVLVTRGEAIMNLAEEIEPMTFFEGGEIMDLIEWEDMAVDDRIKASRGELPPPRDVQQVCHQRQTNVNGPWMKAKDSRKGGTWARRANSQGL